MTASSDLDVRFRLRFRCDLHFLRHYPGTS